MVEKLYVVQKIWQLDNFHFAIEWSDGVVMRYRLGDLQSHCPCAGCGKGVKGDPSLRAMRLYSVGRYALRILFTSGCSAGIYDYPLLRAVGVREGSCRTSEV